MPNEDTIGKGFKGQDPRGKGDDWLTVVGIIRDMRRSGLERGPIPHVYEPYTQAIDGYRTSDLVVRVIGAPGALASDWSLYSSPIQRRKSGQLWIGSASNLI